MRQHVRNNDLNIEAALPADMKATKVTMVVQRQYRYLARHTPKRRLSPDWQTTAVRRQKPYKTVVSKTKAPNDQLNDIQNI
eukprot:1179029-Prorocentrum_minimum.AAC.7